LATTLTELAGRQLAYPHTVPNHQVNCQAYVTCGWSKGLIILNQR